MSATCGTVHCARREHLVAVLIKASLDSARELDNGRKDIAPFNEEERLRLRLIVERTYDACEQLGAEIGAPEEPTPCNHVIIVADVCAKCGAEVPA